MIKKYPDRLLIILGVTLILIKAITPEYIDENGILHEAFYLLPIGFGLILVGIIY